MMGLVEAKYTFMGLNLNTPTQTHSLSVDISVSGGAQSVREQGHIRELPLISRCQSTLKGLSTEVH